jgi:hypothetical protein
MLVSLKYVGVERREEYSFRPSAIVQKSFAIHSVFFFYGITKSVLSFGRHKHMTLLTEYLFRSNRKM